MVKHLTVLLMCCAAAVFCAGAFTATAHAQCHSVEDCFPDVCSNVACVNGSCEYTSKNLCDDGKACTDDICYSDPQGTYECIHFPTELCGDVNPCTIDGCDNSTGCVYTPTCDDGNACTYDGCNTDTGECSPPEPITCNDNNSCTADSCDSAIGCVYQDICGATTTTTTIPAPVCSLTVIPDSFYKLLLSPGAAAARTKGKYNQDIDDGLDGRLALWQTLTNLFLLVGPVDTVLVVGDNGTSFDAADQLQWSSGSITTLLQARFSPRIIGALIFINPFTAQAGVYTVTVAGCSGTLAIEGLPRP